MPWQILCVDLIDPYKFTQSNKEPIMLWALTMIGPATAVLDVCSKYHTCQLTKKGKKKYGKLPSK